MTLENELEIGRQMKSGNFDRREELITENLPLVVSIAKQYTNRGLDLEDLIGYGNIGLVNAADHYDYTLGLKFSTSATNWIKQSIIRALEETRAIHLPEYIITKISTLNKVKNELTNELNRQPTELELSKSLNISISEIRELNNYAQNTISLSTSLNDEDDSTLEDTCASQDETPTEYVERQEISETVERLLSKLSDRDRKIIEMRFGLNGNNECSLEEIGTALNMSKMGVKKVIDRQLELLRTY